MNYVLLQRRENLTVWMNNVKNLTTIVLMDNVKSLTACLEKGKGEKSSESYCYRLEKRESLETNYVKFTAIGHGCMAIFMECNMFSVAE